MLTIKECNFEDISYRLVQTKSKIALYKGEPTASDLSSTLIDAIGEAIGMACKLKDGKVIEIRTIHLQHGQYRFRLADDSVLKIARAEVESIERPKEPARRLRRFWETTMRAKGLGDLIQAMGGHSDAVGLAHYTKFEKIVAAAKVPKLSMRKS